MTLSNVDKNSLAKAMHEAVIETLEKEYKKLGYETSKDYKIGKFIIDLYCASKKDEVFIEVKARGSNKQSFEFLNRMRNEIEKRENSKFIVEYYNIPKETVINIKDFKKKLLVEMNKAISIGDFKEKSLNNMVSKHSNVDEIYNYEINNISIDSKITNVSGIADVCIRLQSDSDGDIKKDDKLVDYKNTSCQFKCEIETENIKIKEIEYGVKKI